MITPRYCMWPMREIIVEEGWRERLQDLAARRRDSWPLLVVVACVALVAVLLSDRSAPAQIAPPATTGAMSSSTPAPSPSPLSVLVHVAGAVKRPGLYEFPEGARVADAVESAGGPGVRANLDALNLAQPLVDGTKVEVLRIGQAAPATSAAPAGTTPAAPGGPGGLIDLNLADAAALETIPGVGPVTAGAILQLRDELGGFDAIEQLLDVDGIGPATFEDIRSYVTL